MSEAELAGIMNVHAKSHTSAFAIYISLAFALLTAFSIVEGKLKTRLMDLITRFFFVKASGDDLLQSRKASMK